LCRIGLRHDGIYNEPAINKLVKLILNYYRSNDPASGIDAPGVCPISGWVIELSEIPAVVEKAVTVSDVLVVIMANDLTGIIYPIGVGVGGVRKIDISIDSILIWISTVSAAA
jgi:hypothetical protein